MVSLSSLPADTGAFAVRLCHLWTWCCVLGRKVIDDKKCARAHYSTSTPLLCAQSICHIAFASACSSTRSILVLCVRRVCDTQKAGFAYHHTRGQIRHCPTRRAATTKRRFFIRL